MESNKKPVNVIKTQAVPKKSHKEKSFEEILAILCYMYPQYTFAEARKLPNRRVLLLIKVAQQQQAMKYYNLTQIVASPHTKKGKGVEKLLNVYQEASQ